MVFRMRVVRQAHNDRTGEVESALLRFEVQDTGVGVNPEVRRVLFAPFEMGTFSRVGHKGSGLGLNICKARAAAAARRPLRPPPTAPRARLCVSEGARFLKLPPPLPPLWCCCRPSRISWARRLGA